MTGVCKFLLAALLLCAAPARAATPISADELEAAVTAGIDRVAELKFIRDKANEMGIRVWLFGGTAAGYAHYVKWDLERIKGDPRYLEPRFDYDYTNIYRSTQDLDIVIDAPAEVAARFQALLQAEFPHFQGTKSAWEVRPLKTKMGDKEALLESSEFANQHTDSNSTGLIELTQPPAGERRMRDLRAWDDPDPPFVEDVRLGKLHYYYSEKHTTTQRFRDGKNPPIFSVVRYLTKAFQYDLEIAPEDWARIKAIVDAFDLEHDLSTSYTRKWMEKNGKKIFQHAVNLDYAAKKLDELGLRKKLSELDSAQQMGSLAWWLNRKPLVAKPLGTHGRTAAEAGITEVAHETSDFLAYESITRSPSGEPNVFVSREDATGEAAAYGEGFYTRQGHRGARGTGFTIRFRLDPNAREGEDFEVVADDYVLIKNKAALKVIPESLRITPAQFFSVLATLGPDDRGIAEKLRRRIGPHLKRVPPEERAEIIARVRDAMKQPDLTFRAMMMESFIAAEPSLAEMREVAQTAPPEALDALVKQLRARNATSDELVALYDYPMPVADPGHDPREKALDQLIGSLTAPIGAERLRRLSETYPALRRKLWLKDLVLRLDAASSPGDYLKQVKAPPWIGRANENAFISEAMIASRARFLSLNPTEAELHVWLGRQANPSQLLDSVNAMRARGMSTDDTVRLVCLSGNSSPPSRDARVNVLRQWLTIQSGPLSLATARLAEQRFPELALQLHTNALHARLSSSGTAGDYLAALREADANAAEPAIRLTANKLAELHPTALQGRAILSFVKEANLYKNLLTWMLAETKSAADYVTLTRLRPRSSPTQLFGAVSEAIQSTKGKLEALHPTNEQLETLQRRVIDAAAEQPLVALRLRQAESADELIEAWRSYPTEPSEYGSTVHQTFERDWLEAALKQFLTLSPTIEQKIAFRDLLMGAANRLRAVQTMSPTVKSAKELLALWDYSGGLEEKTHRAFNEELDRFLELKPSPAERVTFAARAKETHINKDILRRAADAGDFLGLAATNHWEPHELAWAIDYFKSLNPTLSDWEMLLKLVAPEPDAYLRVETTVLPLTPGNEEYFRILGKRPKGATGPAGGLWTFLERAETLDELLRWMELSGLYDRKTGPRIDQALRDKDFRKPSVLSAIADILKDNEEHLGTDLVNAILQEASDSPEKLLAVVKATREVPWLRDGLATCASVVIPEPKECVDYARKLKKISPDAAKEFFEHTTGYFLALRPGRDLRREYLKIGEEWLDEEDTEALKEDGIEQEAALKYADRFGEWAQYNIRSQLARRTKTTEELVQAILMNFRNVEDEAEGRRLQRALIKDNLPQLLKRKPSFLDLAVLAAYCGEPPIPKLEDALWSRFTKQRQFLELLELDTSDTDVIGLLRRALPHFAALRPRTDLWEEIFESRVFKRNPDFAAAVREAVPARLLPSCDRALSALGKR